MTNLQNYVNLSVKDVEGAIGLAWHARRLHAPVALRARGDLQPVRGAERHGRGRRALRLPHLESVRHPERIGAELGHRRPVDEITEWTSVADLKNLRWYFRTFTDQSIHVVDLKEAVEAAKGEVRILKMEGTSQPIADASTNFVAGK